MSDAKPILGEDTIFGRFYYQDTDYAALEAELATVKKVAYGNMELLDENRNLQAELAKLRAGQGRRESGEWKLVPVEPTPKMLDAAIQDGICVDGKPVWKKDVVFQAKWKYQQMLAAAPSAPKADDPVQGVNAQLLEALENTATWIEQLPVPTVGAAGQLVKIDKAIAAARKGEVE